MTRHLISILLITAAILLCMFRPFMPGRYDHLAVTISFMTQAFSFAGLLLVPLGLIWAFSGPGKTNSGNRTKRFRTVSLILMGIITIIVSIVPLSQNNVSFAIVFLAISFSAIARAYIKNKNPAALPGFRVNISPLYLTMIPLIVVTLRFLYIERAVQFSRDLAIRNSEELIQKIEQYFDRNGQYPASLQALTSDISPGVVGISQYFYEPNGNAYNVYFKQFSIELDVEEIVMYNKLDEHRFSAHALDILEYTGDELALRRGDRNRFKLSTPHWISIKFD